MTRVLFDHQAFSWQQFGGITRYIIELARHMPSDIEPRFPAMLSENAYLPTLPDPIRPSISQWTIGNYRLRKKLYEPINALRSGRLLQNVNIDILHPTYYNPYYLRRAKMPVVLTVHDFTHERFPDMLPDARSVINNKRLTVNAATHIIAISESTRRDIIEYYNIPADRISVIYHGYTPMLSPLPTSSIPGLPHDYLLFVGERGPYKNFTTLARAFASIAHRYPTLHLVCAGRAFKPAETALLRQLGINQRATAFPAYGAQLATLYSNARAFVFPSLYEGFGLPVLEAFSANCPTALSNTSSLPEVGGDGALYFDPTSVDDMAQAITSLLDLDTDNRVLLNNRAKAQLGKFAWHKTSAQTAQIYRKLTS